MGSAEDHWLVGADVHLSIGDPRENRRKQSASIDRNLVHDQQRVLNFQNRLEHVVLRDDLEIEPLCSALTAEVANAAIDCFRKCRDEPRKDGLSGHSWSLIKWAQSLRTDLRNGRASVNGMRLAVAFNGWSCIATGDRDTSEWTRAAKTSWCTVCRHAALVLRQLESAQSQKRHSLKTDRRTQWEKIAGDAQQATDRGDTRELYRLARRLGAFKPTPVPGVKLKDGTLASDDDAGLARWAEHFAALLRSKQVDNVKASTFERHEDEQMLQLCNTLDLSLETVSKILRLLSKQRAVGPDAIASEIWIAGGDRTVRATERAHEARRREWNRPSTMERREVGTTLQGEWRRTATRIAACQ